MHNKANENRENTQRKKKILMKMHKQNINKNKNIFKKCIKTSENTQVKEMKH